MVFNGIAESRCRPFGVWCWRAARLITLMQTVHRRGHRTGRAARPTTTTPMVRPPDRHTGRATRHTTITPMALRRFAKFHSVVLSSFTPPFLSSFTPSFCHGLVDIQVGSMVVFATGLSASVAGSRTKKHLGLIRCLIGFGLKVRRRTATMRMVRRQERAPERAGNSGLNVAPSDGSKLRQVAGRNYAK